MRHPNGIARGRVAYRREHELGLGVERIAHHVRTLRARSQALEGAAHSVTEFMLRLRGALQCAQRRVDLAAIQQALAQVDQQERAQGGFFGELGALGQRAFSERRIRGSPRQELE